MLKLYVVLGLVAYIVSGDSSPTSEDISKIDSRLTSGSAADITDYPYQVSLQYSGSHICGGSIIDLDTVLTAAQCFYQDEEPSKYSILTNSSNLDEEGSMHKVKSIRIHGKFNHETMDYDVAVLKIYPNFTQASGTKIIGLKHQGGYVPPGIRCSVTGWGSRWDGAANTNELQVTPVTIKNTPDCRKQQEPNELTDRMICSGSVGCQGDSGNPLVCDGIQIGILSGNTGCNSRNTQVYIKVSSLRDWIVNGGTNSAQINAFVFVLGLVSLFFSK